MTTNDYSYAMGAGIGLNGKKESHMLFRRRGDVVEVRVNRAVEQVQVLSATTAQIDLPGIKLEDYLSAIRVASEGLSEVTTAVYQENQWTLEEDVQVFDSIEPHLIVTGWSADLTDEHLAALETVVEFF